MSAVNAHLTHLGVAPSQERELKLPSRGADEEAVGVASSQERELKYRHRGKFYTRE